MAMQKHFTWTCPAIYRNLNVLRRDCTRKYYGFSRGCPNSLSQRRHDLKTVGVQFGVGAKHFKAVHTCLSSRVFQRKDFGFSGKNTTDEFHDRSASVGEMRKKLEETFQEGNVSEPKESAEFILAHVLGLKTLHAVHPTEPISTEQMKEISALVKRRFSGMPVQYVLGEWDFRDLTLTLAPPVLIPRPETEELVGIILEQEQNVTGGRFLEVGPGAGPICLSLLKAFTLMKCVAVDRSSKACDLTRINAQRAGLLDRIEIVNSPLRLYNFTPADRYNFLVSNPPYIRSHQIEDLAPEVKDFEDRVALDGGVDGMDVIKDILDIGPSMLQGGGSIWLEVDGQHPEQIKDLIAGDPILNERLAFIDSYSDFNQITRFCHIRTR